MLGKTSIFRGKDNKMIEKVRKHLNKLFLNTTPKSQTATFMRVKTSTDFAIAMNAENETLDFIADESPSEELKSYKPSIGQTQTAYIGDPIYDYVFSLYEAQAVGTDAVTQAMVVFQQEKTVGEAKAHIAQLFDVLITVDTYDIAACTLTYTINQRGSVKHGTATVGEDGKPVFNAEVAV